MKKWKNSSFFKKAHFPPATNYGVETVDIAAPGEGILSTLPNNTYGYLTGTSQATAFVTGAAVLVMAHKNIFVPEEVKKFLLATGDTRFNLLKKTKTARVLNMYKALTMMDEGRTAFGQKVVNTSLSTNEKNGLIGDSDPSRDIAAFGKALLIKIISIEKTITNEGGEL